MKYFFNILLPQASTIAEQIDGITMGLLIFCGFILFLIFGLIIIFGIIYRKGSSRSRVVKKGGESILEWSWTGATTAAFMVLFVWGSIPYVKMHLIPPGAMEVTVVAKQWMWKFQHPNGIRELDRLHIPVGVPVLLTMTSQDVIHSFFVPDFRIKQDVLPGRYTRVWFQAKKTGSFHLFCTQYCGTMHADMQGAVIAMEPQDYQKWLATGLENTGNGATLSMADHGRDLFTRLGCISCHGNHPGVQAPALAGIYGKPVGLSDGGTVIADENYLRESILSPGVKIVQGYNNIMPSYTGVVGEEDILALIAYVKSLSGTPQGESGGGP